MRIPSKEEITALREEYPTGTRVRLNAAFADGFDRIKVGTTGTVRFVDDSGGILTLWDNGLKCSLFPDKDDFSKVTKAEVIKTQCRILAQTGRVNLFDCKVAFQIALEMELTELANFMFMNTPAYSHMILTGELSEEDIIEF